MVKRICWMPLGAAMLIAALLACTVLAAGDAPVIGKVSALERAKAQVKRGGTDWADLKVGDEVKVGDQVRTEKKARLEIRLADGSAVRLGSKSTLTLEKGLFPAGGDRQFSGKLDGGQAYAMASKSKGSTASFEIKTSNAVAGVRGTAFRIGKEKATVVRVYSGAVAVSNAPIYAKPGKTTPAGGKTTGVPRQGVKPGGPGRVVVAGPKQVTKQEYEELLVQALQQIAVNEDGTMEKAVAFNPEQEKIDEKDPNLDDDGWVAWNESRNQE
jgi:hypothetical protein